MNTNEIDIIRKQDVLLSNIKTAINDMLYRIEGEATGSVQLNQPTSQFSKASCINKLNFALKQINEFQVNPQLLDKELPHFISMLYHRYASILFENLEPDKAKQELLTEISILVYNFTKIRGVDLVSTLLSTDIQYFAIIIQRLQIILHINASSSVTDVHSSELNQHILTKNWQEISFLLLWLSVLVLAPFNLKSLLGDLDIVNELCFKSLILEQGNSNHSSYLNEINIVLYSKYLSRSDTRDQLIHYYQYLKLNLIKNFVSNNESSSTLTHLKILHKLLKLINYDGEIKDLLVIHYDLVNDIFFETQNKIEENIDSGISNESPMILKFVIKNFGQLALKIISNDDNEDISLERIENIISCLMQSVDHNDTSIRLTNAKNLAKITKLLPTDFQIDILENVISLLNIPIEEIDSYSHKIDINFDIIPINTFHGVFLIFAEFFTNRIVVEHKYQKFIFAIIDSFFFFKRFQIGAVLVGTNIRDAVLFIVWAYLKYNEINEESLLSIFKKLVFVCLFDNDLIIRRSSGAVLQELIGRWGTIIWRKMNISNEYSVKFVESLDFVKLNDHNYSFFENSVNYFEKIPFIQKDFFEFLLNCNMDEYSDDFYIKCFENTSKTGIFAIDDMTKKNSGIVLGKLVEIKMKDSSKIIGLIKNLVGTIKINSEGSVYAISIIFNLIETDFKTNNLFFHENKELMANILNKANSLSYDFHKDDSFKGESILKYLSSFLDFFFLDQESIAIKESKIIDLIFSIIRKNDEFIDAEFKNLVKKISKSDESYNTPNDNAKWLFFLQNFNEKMIYFIKNGNLIASNNFGYLSISILKRDCYLKEIKGILIDKRVSYRTRAKIIISCSQLIKYKDDQLNQIILDQLFDYTLTEQGDVGNIIRFAALSTIEENVENFSQEMKTRIEMRLLRLISEIIDKIKYKALKLLINLKFGYNEVLLDKKLAEYQEVILKNDYFIYYNYIFKMYYDCYLTNNANDLFSYEFLKGICLSAGSLSGFSLNVVKAIDSCVYFFDFGIHDTTVKNKLVNHILYLLRADLSSSSAMNYNENKNIMFTTDNTIRFSCINLLTKLIDSGISLTGHADLLGQDKENRIILKKLYSRCYNVEIKTKYALNLINLVKIYEYLISEKNSDIVKEEASLRLKRLFEKFKDSNQNPLKETIWQSLYNISQDSLQ